MYPLIFLNVSLCLTNLHYRGSPILNSLWKSWNVFLPPCTLDDHWLSEISLSHHCSSTYLGQHQLPRASLPPTTVAPGSNPIRVPGTVNYISQFNFKVHFLTECLWNGNAWKLRCGWNLWNPSGKDGGEGQFNLLTFFDGFWNFATSLETCWGGCTRKNQTRLQ